MNLIDLNNITIGSDPEFFITTKTGNAFPSIGIFDGTKDEPEQKGDGFALLKDNVLVEGNIPPSHNEAEYVEYMLTLQSMINSVLELRGLKLLATDSMKYKDKYLDHPEANVFGCSAYKNAWEYGMFSAENMSHLPIRVAGDHQHIGYQLLTEKMSKKDMNRYIAKAFDYFCVYPSRLHHNDEFRAKYYGPYGVYRDAIGYGLEVRALGGHFTAPEHLSWVYRQTIKAVEFCSQIENLRLLDEVSAPIFKDAKFTESQYAILGVELDAQLIKEDARTISVTANCETSQG